MRIYDTVYMHVSVLFYMHHHMFIYIVAWNLEGVTCQSYNVSDSWPGDDSEAQAEHPRMGEIGCQVKSASQ